jgi:hypothetical protein
MSRRNLFTENEVVLCTYIARFDREQFNESDIHERCSRSKASIKLKVQNIAAMLDEEGYPYSSSVTPLTGLPHGETGRRTNWDVVSKLVQLSESAHHEKCLRIFDSEC